MIIYNRFADRYVNPDRIVHIDTTDDPKCLLVFMDDSEAVPFRGPDLEVLQRWLRRSEYQRQVWRGRLFVGIAAVVAALASGVAIRSLFTPSNYELRMEVRDLKAEVETSTETLIELQKTAIELQKKSNELQETTLKALDNDREIQQATTPPLTADGDKATE